MFESSPDTTAVTSPAYGAADGGQPGPSLAEREERNICFTDLEEFNACWQDHARLTDKQLIVDRDRSGARCRVIYCSQAGCKFKLKVRQKQKGGNLADMTDPVWHIIKEATDLIHGVPISDDKGRRDVLPCMSKAKIRQVNAA
jgi:hypothetical protein